MSNKIAKAIADELRATNVIPGLNELEKFIEGIIDNMPGEVFTPLVRGEMPKLMHLEIQRMAEGLRAVSGQPLEEVIKGIKTTLEDEVWLNDIYQVNVRRGGGIVHLSIKRRDKAPVTDWRHKQAIKNQLVGEECEGIELYPAESRVVDLASQFHLFIHDDPKIRIPIGWDVRMVSGESIGGAKQRKL